MKTFHSSGTASGKVERMWRWKRTIPTTAIVPTVPPWVTSRSNGRVNSITVPMCALRVADRRGQQVLRVVAVELAFALRERFQGVLLIITVTTNGKWRFSFDEAAPHQMQTKTIWAATIMLSGGKRKIRASVP